MVAATPTPASLILVMASSSVSVASNSMTVSKEPSMKLSPSVPDASVSMRRLSATEPVVSSILIGMLPAVPVTSSSIRMPSPLSLMRALTARPDELMALIMCPIVLSLAPIEIACEVPVASVTVKVPVPVPEPLLSELSSVPRPTRCRGLRRSRRPACPQR